MLYATRKLKVWAYPEPADLRKGFDGLYGLVANQLKHNPLSGDYFLFVNRSRNRAKVLLWDGTGLCIYQKRLERDRFACLWRREQNGAIALTPSELSLFLEGSVLVGREPLSPEEFLPSPLDGSPMHT